jgi:hypothetical protein
MKSTILLITLLFCINTNAQEAPELPMKNGYVYYAFNHDLNNSKRCLSYYHNEQTFITNVTEKAFALSTQLENIDQTLDVQFNEDVELNCSDTLTVSFNMGLPEKLPITIFGQYKTGLLTAKINIVFINKNAYKLTFKAFTCTFFNLSGEDMDANSVDLETFYNTFISNTKKTKYEIAVFNLINNAVKGVDKLILESFKKAYETDEL